MFPSGTALQVLEVKLHDYDRVGTQSPLGHVLINLQDVLDAPGRVLEQSWKLEVGLPSVKSRGGSQLCGACPP